MREMLLSSGAVGRVLGVTASRVAQLEREGQIRAMRDSVGRRLFRQVDVDRLVRLRAVNRETAA